MATIGNAPVFPTQSVLPGNLTVTGTSATVNGNEVRTVGTSGAILQVVQATTNTQVAVSSTTYTDTGLTASITPTSSSNKVLVIINQQFQVHRTSAGQGMGYKILRDSTAIYVPPDNSTGPFLSYVNATEHLGVITVNYLDSPSTTSSTTYKAQGRPYLTSSSGVVRFQTSTNGVTAGTSLITLMEVVA